MLVSCPIIISIIGSSIAIPKLSKNEFHYLDLVGLDAKFDADGPAIGKVVVLFL